MRVKPHVNTILMKNVLASRQQAQAILRFKVRQADGALLVVLLIQITTMYNRQRIYSRLVEPPRFGVPASRLLHRSHRVLLRHTFANEDRNEAENETTSDEDNDNHGHDEFKPGRVHRIVGISEW